MNKRIKNKCSKRYIPGKTFISLVLTIVLLVNLTTTISASEVKEDSIKSAIEYLKNIQNDDGGFPAKEGRESNVSASTWVIMALSAAGEDLNANKWKPKDKGPVDYLIYADNELENTNEYARILLALSASNKGSYYKGENLLTSIKAFQKDGHFYKSSDEESLVNVHMWSIIAIASTKSEIPNKEKAKNWLIAQQNSDGGFPWVIDGESDSDDTGIAILTLLLLGEHPSTSEPIKKALNYLETRQESNGGFSASDMMGNDSNAASDAWVIQALIGAGQNINDSRWKKASKTALSHLESLQTIDGSFQWKEGVSSSSVQMTAYAMMALAKKPFPVNLNYDSIISIKSLFSDYDSTNWAYDAVKSLVDKGVINGYPDGSFKANKLVARAEFTSMIIKGLGLDKQSYKSQLAFTDVKKEDWHYNYILAAYSSGIVKGKSEQNFDPNGLITGGELATMLVNSLPDKLKTYSPKGSYWYSSHVSLANRYDLLFDNFDAKAYVTREECAYSIKQLLDLN